MSFHSDKLDKIFVRQREFMNILREHDRLPEFPVDLQTKPGQRLIKEFIFNTVEELSEASFVLKNKMHRLTDDRVVDFEHYKEELGDALAYFIEICILSDISAEDLYDQFLKKNTEVRKKLENGY